MERKRHLAPGGKQQVDAERRLAARNRDRSADGRLARGEMSPFVEFPIIGQIELRHDTQEAAAVKDDAAIIKAPLAAQRRADGNDRMEIAACLQEPLDLPLDLVQKRVLKQQILD